MKYLLLFILIIRPISSASLVSTTCDSKFQYQTPTISRRESKNTVGRVSLNQLISENYKGIWFSPLQVSPIPSKTGYFSLDITENKLFSLINLRLSTKYSSNPCVEFTLKFNDSKPKSNIFGFQTKSLLSAKKSLFFVSTKKINLLCSAYIYALFPTNKVSEIQINSPECNLWLKLVSSEVEAAEVDHHSFVYSYYLFPIISMFVLLGEVYSLSKMYFEATPIIFGSHTRYMLYLTLSVKSLYLNLLSIWIIEITFASINSINWLFWAVMLVFALISSVVFASTLILPVCFYSIQLSSSAYTAITGFYALIISLDLNSYYLRFHRLR